MTKAVLAMVGAVALLACGGAPAERRVVARDTAVLAGDIYTVRDTIIDATLEAAGVAEPFQRATLATKLMGTVVAVLAREGDVVRPGAVLARIDSRDLDAREARIAASLAEAEAVRHDAQTQVGRLRALFADSAATRAQLDAAETGLARAEAGVRLAQSASAELDATSAYASVRAPFAGTVTRRFVDPGAFIASGSPMLTVEDASRLRVTASVAPDAIRGLVRGDRVPVTIEGVPAAAVVEGVVPATTGNVYRVNAVVENRDGGFLAGSAATITLPLGRRPALVIPAAAIRREGDLTGVTLRTDVGDETRWVRVARTFGALVEVGTGLRAGDRIVVPAAAPLSALVPTRGR